MSERVVPEDLQEMYAFAIAWRHEFGSERRYGAATVETLIERIADLTAEVEQLKAPVSVSLAVESLSNAIHSENMKWWQAADGTPLNRNVYELLCLIHSEISEAMEGHRKSLVDDKIPTRTMLEVELADALIRIVDMAAGFHMDLAGAVEEKMAYNAKREDHKREAAIIAARAKETK